ncbi:MAG: hypothetical protein JNK15_16185 [Planctomycetes bacterium]|nr:hypothetical protein [Planctomycetota bacterium]
MKLLDATVISLVLSALALPGAAATTPAHLFQDPAKQDPAKKADELLEAEKEKMRLKDVEGWKKLQVKSMDQVIDVKKATQPLEYPASITEEEKTKLASLLEKAKDGGGGARTGRALKEMEKMGYPAVLFLINQLREIDYKSTDDAFWGYQLNQKLSDITMGINAGYVAVELGDQMDPRKAQWNAMTVQQWINQIKTHWPTREKFDEFITKRKAKKTAELEQAEGGGTEEPKKDDKKK